MASESASQLIIFIASILIAASVSGLLITQTLTIGDASRSSAQHLAQEMRDDVTIINDPADVPYNSTSNNLTLYVKNTGSSSMQPDPALFEVLIDGTIYTDLDVALIQGSDSWGPGEVVEITVKNVDLSTGDHALKVVARSVSDRMEIRR